jgi:hypothetical protein
VLQLSLAFFRLGRVLCRTRQHFACQRGFDGGSSGFILEEADED